MSKSFLLTIAAALAAYLLLPLPGISSSLDNKIGKTRNQIAGKRAHEQVLTTEISSYGVRIETLQGDISDLQTREARVQVQLDAKEAELTRIRNRRQIVQDRLTRLRTKLVADRKLLAGQLVALYKDDEPDMVTVVLEARGFTDLLDRAEYVDRISTQNNEIVTRVRDTTHEVGIAERRLQVLEGQAQDAADAILTKRNQIAAAKQTVVSRQNDLKAARNVRAGALSRIRASRQDLEGNLHDLEARQAKIQARLQAASTGVPVSGGPIRQGSGQFIWPVNGPITSGFGARNIGAGNEFHPGIDIGAATGTPIHAAAAGTVTLEQPEASSGGYGNFTCIQHTSTISTCYGHQSRFIAHVGQHVSQGQVIGLTGCTGRCFGPHLHFEVRINGAVTNPLNYL